MRFASPLHFLRRSVYTLCASLLCVVLATPLDAQDIDKMDIKDLDALSFDALLDIDLLQVASKKPLSKKEIPGTVTLIKREEILNAGARDMIDVLRLVPGFEFGVDVLGMTGMATRGIWGHEGKILCMIDGMQMNETLFATTVLGNRIPLDLIERIEIIRGPGSSFYGGFAELAVINIITRAAGDMNGLQASAYAGQMAGGYARQNLTLSFGKKFGDVGITASAFLGRANRSDQPFTALDSTSFPMLGNNTMQPLNINLGLTYGGLKTRVLVERYASQNRSVNGVIVNGNSINTDFATFLADATYDIKLAEKLTLTPRLSYTQHTPWQVTDVRTFDSNSTAFGSFYDKTASRLLGSLTLSGDITSNLFLTVGAEGFVDNARASDKYKDGWFNIVRNAQGEITSASQSVSYWNVGGYVQALWTNDIVNVNAGLRFDKYSAVDRAAFVPWLGLTKVVGDFNFKLLFGQNFRAPCIENIRANPRILPETTTALELQIGYQIRYNMFLSANIFDVSIASPIVFGSIDNQDNYFNFPRTGSRGVEVEYLVKEFWGYVNLNYSFYTANRNEVENYQTPNTAQLLGLAQHKATLNASIRAFDDNFTINPSFTYLSPRMGFVGTDASGSALYKEYAAVALVNLFLQYKNLLTKGLDVGLGVYDALGANYQFIQPYNSGHAPLPGPSREFVLRVNYLLSFN
jgi:outer membrane cobalamin receptor